MDDAPATPPAPAPAARPSRRLAALQRLGRPAPLRAAWELLWPLAGVLLMGLVVLALLAAGAGWLMLGENGSRWLLQRLPGVEVQGFRGALLGSAFAADRVQLRWDRGRSSLLIEELRADGLLDETFFRTFNPFSFRYVDERVERLATALNAIYGAEYAESCKIHVEPAVFRFETDDIVLHTFASRLRRAHGGDPAAAEILDDFAATVEPLKREMAQFNFALVSDLTDRAERDDDVMAAAAALAAPIEAFYGDRLRAIEAAKLRAGFRLRRKGFDIARIQTAPRSEKEIA